MANTQLRKLCDTKNSKGDTKTSEYTQNDNSILFPCTKCSKEVECNAIECSLCLKWTHRTCAKLSIAKFKYYSSEHIYWYCITCCDIFPFSGLLDQEFIFENSNIDTSENMRDLNSVCHNLESEFRNYIKHKNSELDSSIDPDKNFFDSIDTSCSYFTDTEFKKNVSAIEGLSFIHFKQEVCAVTLIVLKHIYKI